MTELLFLEYGVVRLLTVSYKMTKKRILSVLCVLLAGIIAVLLFFLGGQEPLLKDEKRMAENRAERMEYIRSFGWDVEEGSEKEDRVRLPKVLDDVLTGYNELQKPLGMDLTPYLGKEVIRYSYSVKSADEGEETFVTLYVYDDLIIAADVASHTEHWQRSIDKT